MLRTALAILASSILIFTISCIGRWKVLAKVGRFEITQKAVDYKNQVERAYNAAETRDLGLFLLSQDYKIAQVLEQNDGPITKEILEQEMARIENETQVPTVLAKVKDIFGSDIESYLQIFVLPVYARRHIYYEYFLHDPKPQAKSIQRAQQLAQLLAKKNNTFCNEADKQKVTCMKFVVSKTNGFIFPKPSAPDKPQNKYFPPVPKTKADAADKRQLTEAEAFIERMQKRVKPGQVDTEIQDFREQWAIVRLVGPEPKVKGAYRFEAAQVPKDSFQEWLNLETAKVKVEVKSGYSLEYGSKE